MQSHSNDQAEEMFEDYSSEIDIDKHTHTINSAIVNR